MHKNDFFVSIDLKVFPQLLLFSFSNKLEASSSYGFPISRKSEERDGRTDGRGAILNAAY